jgi:hypothetical protein
MTILCRETFLSPHGFFFVEVKESYTLNIIIWRIARTVELRIQIMKIEYAYEVITLKRLLSWTIFFLLSLVRRSLFSVML